MYKRALILAFVFCSMNSFGQPFLISLTGDITFFSYALIENIQAESKQVNSKINCNTGEIAFVIPIRSFQFKKSLMQEHFNEKYMESDKFPQATFTGMIDPVIDFSRKGMYPISVSGKMNIHGHDKTIKEYGQISIDTDTIVLTSEFRVALQDYNIKKPELLFNNIADTILVKMKAIYIPFSKK